MAKSKQGKSLNLAVVFSAIFILLILISLTCKVINVFQKSNFTGENHFTVSVTSEEDKVSLVSFAPKSNSIFILNIKEAKNKNLSSILEIPIDGEINANTQITDKNLKSSFFGFLIPFSVKKTNLTAVDLARLWMYSNSVPVNGIYEREISVDEDILKLKSLGVYSYFIDQAIAEEKIGIEIVNGTEIFGLGNKLASFISNMGGNVVMVSTSEKTEDKSRIDYFGEENYTLKKISRILNLKPNKVEKRKLGDIIIVIGKDSLDKLKF